MKLLSKLAIIFFTLMLMVSGSMVNQKAYASPTDCVSKIINPEVSSTFNVNGVITIQCSGPGTWGGIIKTARLSAEQKSNFIRSYDKTGGSSNAMTDFNKMPGTTQSTGDSGVLLKSFEGNTLTYYPKSTSTGAPTLQYPSLDISKTWDKIRYYE